MADRIIDWFLETKSGEKYGPIVVTVIFVLGVTAFTLLVEWLKGCK